MTPLSSFPTSMYVFLRIETFLNRSMKNKAKNFGRLFEQKFWGEIVAKCAQCVQPNKHTKVFSVDVDIFFSLFLSQCLPHNEVAKYDTFGVSTFLKAERRADASFFDVAITKITNALEVKRKVSPFLMKWLLGQTVWNFRARTDA